MTYPTDLEFGEIETRPVSKADANPDIRKAVEGITASVKGYEAAREYDDINLWEQFAISRLGQTLRQADIEFDPNFCGIVIDTVSNKMEITSLAASTVSSSGAAGTSPSEEATKAVNQVWDDNKLGIYWPVWQRHSLRDGDGYLVAWPLEFESDAVSPTGDELNPLNALPTGLQGQPKATKINITYVDPVCGRMYYDDTNPRVKKFFAQMWEVPSSNDSNRPDIRLNLFYPDRLEKYIAKGASGPQQAEFEMYIDEFELVVAEDETDTDAPGEPELIEVPVWPVPNPYGKIPVFHLRTSLEYGKPEHRNAFALQDAISKLVEMQMVTVQFQGFPQAYALQEADSYKSQSIQEDPLADSSPATIEDDFASQLSTDQITADPDVLDTETGSRIESSPGSIALLKGFKEVGQFTTADPAAFLEPWREYAKAISATTDTPLYKFQGLGGNVPSGESLKIVDAPTNKKAKDRMRLFTAELRDMFEFCLELMGIEARVTLTWANPGTTDLKEIWDLVKLKIDLGIPPKDALMDAGIPDTQAELWATSIEERRKKDDELARLTATSRLRTRTVTEG